MHELSLIVVEWLPSTALSEEYQGCPLELWAVGFPTIESGLESENTEHNSYGGREGWKDG